MDITKITDLKELKALAYDEMASLEQIQTNLKIINQQIAKILQADSQKDK